MAGDGCGGAADFRQHFDALFTQNYCPTHCLACRLLAAAVTAMSHAGVEDSSVTAVAGAITSAALHAAADINSETPLPSTDMDAAQSLSAAAQAPVGSAPPRSLAATGSLHKAPPSPKPTAVNPRSGPAFFCSEPHEAGPVQPRQRHSERQSAIAHRSLKRKGQW